jgi:hypothetical protein
VDAWPCPPTAAPPQTGALGAEEGSRRDERHATSLARTAQNLLSFRDPLNPAQDVHERNRPAITQNWRPRVAKAWQNRRTLCRQMPWQPTTVSDEEQVVLHSVSPMTWKTRKRAAGPVRRTHLVAVPPTCSWKAAQSWHPIPCSSLCKTLVCSRQTLQLTRISGSSEQSQFPNSHTCLQRNTEGIA